MNKELSTLADQLKLQRATLQVGTDFDDHGLEHQLLETPDELLVRALLIKYYGTKSQCGHIDNKFAEMRLHHILWFVENIPESKFVSNRLCSVPTESKGHDRLRALWLDLLNREKSTMVCVNAFLFFHEHGDKQIELFTDWLEKFPCNPWVRALKRMLDPSLGWEYEIEQAKCCVDIALSEKFPPPTDVDRYLTCAGHASERGTYEELTEAINALMIDPSNFLARAQILGFTFDNYRLDNPVGYDPELVAMRFTQMYWLALTVPAWNFLKSAFAMDPFDDELRSLNLVLKEVWLKQIKDVEGSEAVLANAAIFGTKSNDLAIRGQLNRTKLGKVVLKKIRRQYASTCS